MLKKVTLFRILLVALLLGVCLFALKLGRQGAVIVAAAEQPADLMTTDPNCRYGVAAISSEQVLAVPTFHAGWFVTFETEASANAPADSEFGHIVFVKQNKDSQGNYLPGYYVPGTTFAQITALVQANPGELWMIGNEVDRGPDPGHIHGGQGDMYPDVYATAYHDLYYLIKAADPTAQVAISGLVEVTPGRLQYLDLAWQAYYDQFGAYMPVDVWNMHIYALPEAQPNGQPNGVANVALGTDLALAIREGDGTPADCPDEDVYCWAEHDDLDIFKDQVVAMRTWMKAHGQQNKPLILSEFSILYTYFPSEIESPNCYLMDEYGQCFTPQRVSAFAEATLNYLQYEAIDPDLGYPPDNDRLVQQWLWFAIHSGSVGQSSNLMEQDLTTLTLVGETWKNYVEALPSNINLSPAQTPPQWADIVPPATSAEATLAVWIRNNGNTLAPPVTVTFYSDAALTQEIATTTVNNVRGCGRDQYLATVTWSNLTAGIHRFWVKADSPGTIPETNENDNVSTSLVFVDGSQIYLPITRR
jgi:hypothetical protein